MNQSERRQYLIRELIAEDKEYQRLAIPKDEGGQKVLLRALMNVRAPKPCGEEFLKIQDAYLQEEIRKEGITDADSLTPVRDELISGREISRHFDVMRSSMRQTAE